MKKLLLTLTFIIMFASQVFAGNIGDISNINNAKCITDYSDTATVEEIDTVTFGSYPQSDVSGNVKEPIEWIVLEKQKDKALLLSKYVLDEQFYFSPSNEFYREEEDYDEIYLSDWNKEEFEEELEERKDIISNYWVNSDLNKWLNNDFYNVAFSEDEKSPIIYLNEKKKSCPDGTSRNPEININGKVYCLTWNDIVKYESNIDFTPNLNKKFFTNRTQYAYTKNNNGSYDGFSNWWLSGINIKGSTKPCSIYSQGIQIISDSGFEKGRTMGVRPAIWVSYNQIVKDANTIPGLPSRESELRSDNHFYLDNNMQKSTWVYYLTYYYHVDGAGNIEKSKWIEQRYVGEDGRMYRGRQTPDGKWVGDDGLAVNVSQDLSKSLTIIAAESDSWYKTESGLWYYFENDRTTTKKGWFTDVRDNQTYYLDPNTGIMAVGWTNIDGKMYYFNELSATETNWYEVGNGFYESYGKKIKALGSMYKNETTPDGKKVDANGRLIK